MPTIIKIKISKLNKLKIKAMEGATAIKIAKIITKIKEEMIKPKP